jgi:carbonic anhydrase
MMQRRHEEVTRPDMGYTDELLEHNAAYARAFDKGTLHGAPVKRVAILACMDARIDVYRVFGLQEGDAHVIRNAGGLPTTDAIRSLVISQRVLGTEEIVLLHHTDCGMTKLSEEDLRSELERETGQSVPFELGAISDLEQNLRESLERIRTDPFIPNKASVRGFVYDVTSGRLNEVGRAAGA